MDISLDPTPPSGGGATSLTRSGEPTEAERLVLDETAPTGVPTDVQPERPKKRRRRRIPRAKPWWIRLHRWIALVMGTLMLLECVSGSILLVRPEYNAWTRTERWHHTASAHPLTAAQAISLVQHERPDLEVSDAFGNNGVWKVVGEGPLTAYVDPGAGRINTVTEDEPWVMSLMGQVHECFFGCEGQPAYVPLLAKPMPIPGAGLYTVGTFLLGVSGLCMAFLAISGIIMWWPALRKWGKAFQVRRGKGAYARDLDLHKLIGIIAAPMILMWGVTGMNLVGFQWPNQVFYAIAPGGAPDDTPVTAKPAHKAGKIVTPAEAEQAALAAMPGGRTVGLRSYTPEEQDGSYLVNVGTTADQSIDRVADDLGETQYVTVDSHTGAVTYSKPLNKVQDLWQQTIGTLHTGGNVKWLPRFFLEVPAALTIVALSLTGITIWLTKWRSRRARRQRRRLAARQAR